MSQDRTPSTSTTSGSDARVLNRFPAGHPRGNNPAEEFAAAQAAACTPATVVMDLRTDEYVVKAVHA